MKEQDENIVGADEEIQPEAENATQDKTEQEVIAEEAEMPVADADVGAPSPIVTADGDVNEEEAEEPAPALESTSVQVDEEAAAPASESEAAVEVAAVEVAAQVEEVAPAKDGKEAVTVKFKVKKAFSITLNVILYIFLAFSVFMLIFSLASRGADGAVNLFGYEARMVVSSSMEKSENSVDVSGYEIQDLKVRTMVFIDKVPQDAEEARQWYSELKVGDVLTFKYVMGSSQEVITHRIIDIAPTKTGYIIKLQGDNRSEGSTVSTQTIYTSSEDYPNQNAMYNFVLGKVVGNSNLLGFFVYSVRQPLGISFIIIIPCAIIIIWQIVRIFSVFSEDRKKKAEAKIKDAEQKAEKEAKERESQAQELEELKRRLAELENKKTENSGDDGVVG